MDPNRAQVYAERFIGKRVGNWEVLELIGAGRSAAVFGAKKEGIQGAIKIFDEELVNQQGIPNQLERINRELRLKGHDHPNVVSIFDGGHCKDTGCLYVVMERLNWPTLDSVLEYVPRDRILPLISKLALAAKYLEEQQLVHRDIKPSNIAVSKDFQDCKLLDLGVLRPIGGSDITDHGYRPFIGTLRYSSPEFLHRKEVDTIDGWRAVTFYQLGGVLHDLIMRKRLFEEYSEPYAKLVYAISDVQPEVVAADLDRRLIVLAKNCLLKDPITRAAVVSWDQFEQSSFGTQENIGLKQRLLARQQAAKASTAKEDDESHRQKRRRQRAAFVILNEIEGAIREVVVSSDLLPYAEYLNEQSQEKYEARFIVNFDKSEADSLPAPLSILLKVIVIDSDQTVIKVNAHYAFGKMCTLADYDVTREVTIFEGVYDLVVLKQHFDSVLHNALDKAQAYIDKHGLPKQILYLNLKEGDRK